MKTNLIIHFNVKSNQLQEFAGVLKQVKQDLPNVAGCLGVQVFQSQSNEQQYTLVESWESQAQHEAHIKNLVESGVWDEFVKHLQQEPVSAYYSLI